MENYSILMSVYAKVEPEYLAESIKSMLNQTHPCDDFVIVCDGPLTHVLDAVISGFTADYPGLFQIVRLPENVGIGAAANAGLAYCRNEWVAKMDADDISCVDRCEKQMRIAAEHPEYAIIGSYISEFVGTTDNVQAIRWVPQEDEDIKRYARRRMPFNNQTVLYRKSEVLRVGGYSNMRRCEDYDLYARMLGQGVQVWNVPEVLVHYRLTADAIRRRATKENVRGFVTVRWRMYRRGFCSLIDFAIPCCGQLLLMILPATCREKLYKRYLRY